MPSTDRYKELTADVQQRIQLANAETGEEKTHNLLPITHNPIK